MAFMFADMGGEIRIGNYTPTTAQPLGKAKEAALIEARSHLAETSASNGLTRYVIPGMAELPPITEGDGYFARSKAISTFRAQVEAFLKGGAK